MKIKDRLTWMVRGYLSAIPIEPDTYSFQVRWRFADGSGQDVSSIGTISTGTALEQVEAAEAFKVPEEGAARAAYYDKAKAHIFVGVIGPDPAVCSLVAEIVASGTAYGLRLDPHQGQEPSADLHKPPQPTGEVEQQ